MTASAVLESLGTELAESIKAKDTVAERLEAARAELTGLEDIYKLRPSRELQERIVAKKNQVEDHTGALERIKTRQDNLAAKVRLARKQAVVRQSKPNVGPVLPIIPDGPTTPDEPAEP